MKRWIGLGILCLASAANAQAPAVDPAQPEQANPPAHVRVAPPSPMPLRLQQRQAARERLNLLVRGATPQQLEKAAYLGVSVSPVPPSLREQLKLQSGMGLLVDHVEKGSPAESAGIKRYDVLRKLNDQLLINAQQLQVLVRSFKPGEEVKLTIIQQGQEKTIPVKLAERELPPLSEEGPWNVGPDVWRELRPNVDFERFMREIPDMQPVDPFLPPAPRPPLTTRPANRRLFELDIMAPGGESKTVVITAKDGQAKMTVKDKDGNVIYEGPLHDEEQLKTLPPDVRRMIERLGVRTRLGFPEVAPRPDTPKQPPSERPGNRPPAVEHAPAPVAPVQPPPPPHQPRPEQEPPSQPI